MVRLKDVTKLKLHRYRNPVLLQNERQKRRKLPLHIKGNVTDPDPDPDPALFVSGL